MAIKRAYFEEGGRGFIKSGGGANCYPSRFPKPKRGLTLTNTSFERFRGIKKYGVYTKGDSQEGDNKVKSVEKPVFNRVYPNFGRCKNN